MAPILETVTSNFKNMETTGRVFGFLGMFILFMVMGCSSSDDSNGEHSLPDYDYFLRYEVDGVVEEFFWDYDIMQYISGAINYTEEGGSFYMTNSTSLVHGISILFTTTDPIVAGQNYTQEDFVYLLATYKNDGEYYTTGYAVENAGFATTDLEVMVTEIGAGEARGTFSGTFDGMDDETVSITNGEFFMLLGTDEVPEQ